MLGGRECGQRPSLVLKHHRIRDDLIVEGNLQGHKTRVVGWAVATQHPRLNQGCRHGDLVKQATVIIAGFLPWACDENLHSSGLAKKRGWSLGVEGGSAPGCRGRGAGLWLSWLTLDRPTPEAHPPHPQTSKHLSLQGGGELCSIGRRAPPGALAREGREALQELNRGRVRSCGNES